MGYRDHSAFLKFLRYQSLNLLLGDDVNISGGFIKQNDFVLSQDCAADADQLLLPWWEVPTIFCHFEIKTVLGFLILFDLFFRVWAALPI